MIQKGINKETPEFIEVQKITQWWLWLILGGVSITMIIMIIGQVFYDRSSGLSITGLIILSAISFGIVILFAMLRLKTTITESKISVHFFPLAKREFKRAEIKRAEVIKYGFVGGWGIRLWTDYGTVYNIRGNVGLFIEINNGDKFLVGTQHKDVLTKVMMKTKKNPQ